MQTDISSKQRILTTAADLFFRQGFQKTSLDEVAFQAGVTRVTVYRHFGDKRGLVGAVCESMAAAYRQAEAECRDFPERSLAECLAHAREHFARLPKSRLGPGFEELGRLYPDLFAALRTTYRAAMDGVFD
jgi:AcrR family transcriptional regulator